MENPLRQDLEHILEHTAGIWEDLRGARLFITGGTGFFGCWLLESFAFACDRLQLETSATVLTRSAERFAAKAPHLAGHRAIRLWEGDVRSFAFPAGPFSHVIHAATESAAPQQPLAVLDTIAGGTRRALDFAVRAGAKRFLLTSSGAVYGAQPPELTHVPESYRGAPETTDPRSTYGESKRVSELLASIYYRERGLECGIARCFAFFGPYLPLDHSYAAGNFLGDVLAGGPVRISGDGTPYRSYLYAADLAIWLWTILLRGKAERPYNVGSPEAVTIRELAERMVAAVAPGMPVEAARQPVPGAPAPRYVPATERAQGELGLKAWIGLEEAVRRTYAWHRRHASAGR